MITLSGIILLNKLIHSTFAIIVPSAQAFLTFLIKKPAGSHSRVLKAPAFPGRLLPEVSFLGYMAEHLRLRNTGG